MPTYDTRTALLIVDTQNDFADPAGNLSVKGGDEIVPVLNEQIALARAAGAFVIYTQDWHPEHTPHFAVDGGIWPVHCVRGTWGAQLHPALEVAGPIIQKGSNGEDGYSGFTMRDPASGVTVSTPLEGLLRDAGITALVVCGLATDYCVLATTLDAISLGFPVTVLAEGIRAVDLEPGDGDRALAQMRDAGARIEPGVGASVP
jgi:nicotinamidase/pyrazinamidase